jgi:hypothetical protein
VEKVGAAKSRVLGGRVAVKGLAPNAGKALDRGTVKDSGVRPGGKVLRVGRSLIGKVGVRVKGSIVRDGKARTTVRECGKGSVCEAKERLPVRKPVLPLRNRNGGGVVAKGSVRIATTGQYPMPVLNSVHVTAKGLDREGEKGALRIRTVQ